MKLHQIIKKPLTNPQIKRVADLVIENTNTDIFIKSRERSVIDARSLFDYLMRVEYQQTYANIQNYYFSKKGKCTHATIIHSVKNFQDVVYRNPHYLDIIDVIQIQEVSPKQLNNLIILISKIKTKKELYKIRDFAKDVLKQS